jgi:hypothetical protein
MMEAVRTSETSVDNHFTRQYIPEDNSRRRENLKSQTLVLQAVLFGLPVCNILQISHPVSLDAVMSKDNYNLVNA